MKAIVGAIKFVTLMAFMSVIIGLLLIATGAW